MRHVRMLGLCVVAALAIGAYAVSNAAALPEWGKCEANAGGKYSDANCTVKAKKGAGSFEWKKGASLKPVKFTGANVGSGGVLYTHPRLCAGGTYELQLVPDSKCVDGGGEVFLEKEFFIECKTERNSGEAIGKDELKNIDVVFTGCEAFGAAPCSNTETQGEIKVNVLKGKLGYINKSEKKVGVLLEPVAKHGEFAKFTCSEGLISTVVGQGNTKQGAWYPPENKGGNDGIISPITPVNTTTTKYEQQYTVNTETDENIPSKFEGGKTALLEANLYVEESGNVEFTKWSPAAEEITNVNTAAEAGEIKA